MYTVALSRLSSIPKDERAENLTSAPGGRRCRYSTCRMYLLKQELSYRKQVACQLRTQYVEGIITHDLEI